MRRSQHSSAVRDLLVTFFFSKGYGECRLSSACESCWPRAHCVWHSLAPIPAAISRCWQRSPRECAPSSPLAVSQFEEHPPSRAQKL